MRSRTDAEAAIFVHLFEKHPVSQDRNIRSSVLTVQDQVGKVRVTAKTSCNHEAEKDAYCRIDAVSEARRSVLPV